MKGNRLKTLGFALLGGLALLFAGCGQQQAGTGGQELPKPIQVSVSGVTPNQLVSGVADVWVSINEDSQAQEVALFVDDVLVAKYNISTQGVRPQALSYKFTVNTAACDPAFLTSTATGCSLTKNTPLFTNGTRTVKAVVKNPVETKTLSVPVVLDNQDRIGFVIEGNNAQDANGDTWYGNGDVKVKGVVVSYTGATYSFAKVNDTTWKINRTGGTASDSTKFLPSGNQSVSGGGAKLSAASALELTFAKSDNSSVEGSVTYQSIAASSLLGTAPVLRLDNKAPGGFGLHLQRTYEQFPGQFGGNEANQKTKLFRDGGSDGGVGVDPASFQVLLEYGIPAQTVTKANGQDLSDIPAAVPNITVKKLVLKDKLGNTGEVTTGLPTLTFDNTAPTLTLDDGSGSPPAATGTAGQTYNLRAQASDSGTGLHAISFALVSGGKYYIISASSISPWNINPDLLKLGDGSSASVTYAVIAWDKAGNNRIISLTPTVAAASAVDQQAPVVNSLTASGSLTAGDATSTVTLTAKASEKPTHSSGSVTFIYFFAEHSNLPGYLIPVSVASTSGGSAEDTATSASILGNLYPVAGTFGTAVLVRDGSFNATLANGTLNVQ